MENDWTWRSFLRTSQTTDYDWKTPGKNFFAYSFVCVDIILGGSPDGQGDSKWQENHDKIIELGGLHSAGTERHEARRIDNQLRGRAGRQGDPGSSRFYVSLEDDVIHRFGGERIKGFMEWAGMDEDHPIENKLVKRSIESAQVRVEGYHFDMRKHLVEYDDVVNQQR